MRGFLISSMMCLLSVWAVGQTQGEVEEVEGWVVHGVLEGKYNADKVYLIEEDAINGPSRVIDSCEVVDNRYTFKGPKVEYPRMYFIKSADPECLSPITPFFVENGVINIRAKAQFFINAEAKGTANNDIFAFHNFLTEYIHDSIGRIYLLDRKIYGERDYDYENAEFKRRSKFGTQRDTENQIFVAERYRDQVFAPFLVYWSLRHRLPLEDLKALRAKLDPKLNDHPYMKQLDEYIRLAAFNVGSLIPEFEVPDQNGKMVNIKDLRGKYVLIDFWASWCGPCLREMPNVVKLYKECKGKNFEILGISLDRKKEEWIAAIKKNGMKWIQTSELKMWDSQPAKLCNVSAVPYTILVDPKGEVIALDLRGEELIEKVKEVLGKK